MDQTKKLPADIPIKMIETLCQDNHIIWLALFGSVLRDDFDEQSDVDVVVRFAPDARVGLIGVSRMARELGEILGREVDLMTPEFLSQHFREKVLQDALVIYEKAA
jgi:uncharacterized protein